MNTKWFLSGAAVAALAGAVLAEESRSIAVRPACNCRSQASADYGALLAPGWDMGSPVDQMAPGDDLQYAQPGGAPPMQFLEQIPISRRPTAQLIGGSADRFEYFLHPDKDAHPRATILRVEAPEGSHVYVDGYEVEGRHGVWRHEPREPLMAHQPNIVNVRVDSDTQGTSSRAVRVRLRPGKLALVVFR